MLDCLGYVSVCFCRLLVILWLLCYFATLLWGAGCYFERISCRFVTRSKVVWADYALDLSSCLHVWRRLPFSLVGEEIGRAINCAV